MQVSLIGGNFPLSRRKGLPDDTNDTISEERK